jgi:hypothetical protein
MSERKSGSERCAADQILFAVEQHHFDLYLSSTVFAAAAAQALVVQLRRNVRSCLAMPFPLVP